MPLRISINGGKAPHDLDRFIVNMKNQDYLVHLVCDGILLESKVPHWIFLGSGGWSLLIENIFIQVQGEKMRLRIQFRSEAIAICAVCLLSLFIFSMLNISTKNYDLQKLSLIFTFGTFCSSLIIVFSLISSLKRDIKKAVVASGG